MSISIEHLRQVSIFNSLQEEDLDIVLSCSFERAIEEGSFFFHQGGQASYMYVLISGKVILNQITEDGHQVALRMVTPWQMFGAIGMVQPGSEYPVSARALEDSQALAWENEIIRSLIEDRPQVAIDTMKLMTGYIREMQDRYREQATERVERRIAHSLLRLVAQAGKKVEGGILIDFDLTRQNLAELSGTTLFTVSRTLSEWEREGLIQTGRERILITDPHGLVRISEDLK